MKRMVWLGVAVLACACGKGSSSSSSSSSSSGGASSLLSLGSAGPGMAHVAIPDDAEVPMVAGPQGGHHIWLSVGLPLGTVANASDGLEAQYHVTNGATVMADGRTFLSLRDQDGLQQDSGATMFLMETPDLATMAHQPLDIDVTLRTQSGATVASAHRRWKVTCCSSGGFGNGDGHGVDGGVTGGSGPQDCAGYCALVAPGCGNSTPPVYASNAACLADCATFSMGGVAGFGAGNTLQCRYVYAQQAVGDVGACRRLASSIAGFCVDGCGYYCRLMGERCPQEAFTSTCLAACQGYPTTGQEGDLHGNTLQCRINYAETATPDPVPRCANASPSGGTECVP